MGSIHTRGSSAFGQRKLEAEGRTLVECLGGRWSTAGGMCRCPAHKDRTPSLSVRPGRTRLLFHCFAGCHVSDVLRALEIRGLLAPSALAEEARSAGAVPSLDDLAHRIWNESRSIGGTPAERYLASRGLHSSSSELRYHPRAPHGRSPLTRYRRALIAAVRDESGIVGIHRTFLDQDERRTSGRRSKCSLGRFASGAVRLGGAAPRLGLAEGIETALSASLLFGVPCWATLGVERFRLVALPSDVEELLLFLDHDAGGHRAEALALEAFAHLVRVEARYPPRAGEDWNDVLCGSASASTTMPGLGNAAGGHP